MRAKPRPRHQRETEFHGEIQVFSGPALAPDDPRLEPRVRKGRPSELKRRTKGGKKDRRAEE